MLFFFFFNVNTTFLQYMTYYFKKNQHCFCCWHTENDKCTHNPIKSGFSINENQIFIPSGFKLSEAACKHLTMLRRQFILEQKFYFTLLHTHLQFEAGLLVVMIELSCSSTQPCDHLPALGGGVCTL